MNDDLISRAAAFDSVEIFLKQTDAPEVYPGLIPALARVINNVPSAQQVRTQMSSADCISRQSAIDRINKQRERLRPDIYEQDYIGDAAYRICAEFIERLPSAQPEWNNHTVACMLAELFDDTCACNYNGIDEWLPEKCELLDSCPNPAGVACWEQFLKHRAERRTDEAD